MKALKTSLRVITFLCFAMISAGLSANDARAATLPGTLEYSYVAHAPRFYNGTNWYGVSLGIALGSCSREGSLDFDTVLTAFKYCNGTNWIRVLGSLTLAGCSTRGSLNYSGGTFLVCNGLLWIDIKGSMIIS